MVPLWPWKKLVEFLFHIQSPRILARHAAESEAELRLPKIAAAEGLQPK